MTPRNPIEFVRQLANGLTQRAGNRVQLEDANGQPFDLGNQIPVVGPLTAAELAAMVVAVQLQAGAAHIGEVGSWQNVVQATLTRPTEAPAVQYAALDAMTNSLAASTAIEFANALRVAGQTGFVIGGRMRKSTVSVTNTQFRLHLFTAAPAAIANDNAPHAEAWANRLTYVGYMDFVSFRAGSDCAESPGLLSRTVLGYKPTSGTSLFGVMQALAAYTPVSAEQFAISLDVVGS